MESLLVGVKSKTEMLSLILFNLMEDLEKAMKRRREREVILRKGKVYITLEIITKDEKSEAENQCGKSVNGYLFAEVGEAKESRITQRQVKDKELRKFNRKRTYPINDHSKNYFILLVS